MNLTAMTSPPEAPQRPADFRSVIAQWPATRSFARDAGCSASLVRQWRHRNFIPPQYWPAIAAGAARRGIAVDVKLLAALAAVLRGKSMQRAGGAASQVQAVNGRA